jgi:hypothetical protein
MEQKLVRLAGFVQQGGDMAELIDEIKSVEAIA